MPFLIHSARHGRPFSVWGDGSARKDFLHHTDFTAALDQVIRLRPQGIFNVSHGASHSVSEVIDIAGDAIEPPPQFGTPIRNDLIEGMAKVGDGFLVILKPSRAFDMEVLTQLVEQQASL